ncbi:glycosyltransferase [Parafrankia sp. EUN1f]|uniref:glycosyltransferase n=1 Tax=Parafrankia sp. EUN1f TaxID=102897 RepID=UPI0001C43A9D|nr:glycosyltransferase [Parafrankia sp. EUN1f]EFC83560.1 glycosyl transferase family 2 [Parafrankia sp. EUN1f]
MDVCEVSPTAEDGAAAGSDLPLVSVVIVTFNSAPVLAECLAALPAACGRVPVETLVVDNASGDATLEVARAAGDGIRIVSTGGNVGYAAAINRGIRAASSSASAVLVLNPDIRLHPGAVPAMLELLERPGTGVVAPRLLGADGTLAFSLRREPSVGRAWGEALFGGRAGRWPALGEVVVAPGAYEAPSEADWATGAALLVSRQCLEAVGDWDEAYFLYSEETDFLLRVRDAGFRLRLAPAAVGVHLGGESGTSPALWTLLTANRLRLFRSRHGLAASAAFTVGVLTGELLRAASGRAISKAAVKGLLTASQPRLVERAGGRQPGAVSTGGRDSRGGRGSRGGRAGALGPRLANRIPAVIPLPVRSAGSPGVCGTPTRAVSATHALPADVAGTPPIVCFSGQDWWYHNRAHSDFQLMTRIAAHRPVLFVNSLAVRMPLPGRSTQPLRRIARKAKSISRGVRTPRADLPDFHVLSPVLLPLYGSRAGRVVNAWLVRFQVARVAKRLGLRAPAYFVTMPTAWDTVRPLARSGLLYNRSDKHSEFTESNGAVVAALEDELLRHSDRVLYVSHELMSRDGAAVADRAHFLGHGVDLGHFNAATAGPAPADIARIPGPRIGFFGGLDDYTVDFDLLEQVAAQIPTASLVLIGDATCSMRRFEAYSNVHWLGFRPYEQIPAYGAAFDVAIMPWLRNEWIRFCNPIKLKEYLALGLPVVTTDYPQIASDRGVVRVAGSPEAFVELIRDTIADGGPGDPAGRRRHVERDSWDARAEELLELIDKITRETSAPGPAGRRGRRAIAGGKPQRAG